MESEPTAQTTNQPAAVACRKLTVVNRMGIHARPATRIVELTNTFRSKVTITKDGEAVDGKSIFGVMTLAAIQGTVLTVRAEGDDAEELLDALENLFTTGFEEQEDHGGGKGSQETSG
ncbi:MAG: HPr family phosphocarrier protein [Planctomycetota bacterium]|jgi:phosphotransferase system HPr (HPr) family protein